MGVDETVDDRAPQSRDAAEETEGDPDERADPSVAGVAHRAGDGGEADDDQARGRGLPRRHAEQVDQGRDGEDGASAPERPQDATDEQAEAECGGEVHPALPGRPPATPSR
ncbi:hypothetical protein GCM10017673_19660 [Streptosporangium violaceochromogenes]|nr:hypothetical protein GCM10017673_19660 [Streptosporangium violaceochromogenes]